MHHIISKRRTFCWA